MQPPRLPLALWIRLAWLRLARRWRGARAERLRRAEWLAWPQHERRDLGLHEDHGPGPW